MLSSVSWVGGTGWELGGSLPTSHPAPPMPGESCPKCSSGCQAPFCVCAGSERPPGPAVPHVTATQGHPSCTGVGDSHPPRAARSSPLPAQELRDPHPRAAPSLSKGRGLGRGTQGWELRHSHDQGRSGTPQPGHHPPISILAPGGGEEPEAGGTGLSQRAACCSPARRLCSVTQHSLTAPSPTAAASSPSPGGTHDPRLPPALPQPLSCQSHPVVPLLAVYPHPRTTGGSSSRSTGRDPPSRGSERWRAGWGVSLQAPITSAVPVDPSGSGPAGLPAQSPRWDQGS